MRPREFDEEHLLSTAFAQFRSRGFRGTSISDIARAAGVQRGSVYNAFDSKSSLFLAAYRPYADAFLQEIEHALGTGTLHEKLSSFFSVSIRNFSSGDPPLGCPTTRGLMEVSEREKEGLPEAARAEFARLLSTCLRLLIQAFQEGKVNGEFSGKAENAAEIALAAARGLVVLERAFADRNTLDRIASNTVDLLLASSETDESS